MDFIFQRKFKLISSKKDTLAINFISKTVIPDIASNIEVYEKKKAKTL